MCSIAPQVVVVRLGTIAAKDFKLCLGGSVAARGYLPLGEPRAHQGSRRGLHRTRFLDVISRCVQSVVLSNACLGNILFPRARLLRHWLLAKWGCVLGLIHCFVRIVRGRHRPASSVPCPALLDASPFSSSCSYGRNGCHEGGCHSVHEAARSPTICFFRCVGKCICSNDTSGHCASVRGFLFCKRGNNTRAKFRDTPGTRTYVTTSSCVCGPCHFPFCFVLSRSRARRDHELKSSRWCTGLIVAC